MPISEPRPALHLSLLGAWRLSRGDRTVVVGPNGKRLFAFVALHGPCDRPYVSGVLWPDCSEAHASGSLRTTLCRLHRQGLGDVVQAVNGVLSLSGDVDVDVDRLVAAVSAEPCPSTLHILTGDELLIGWCEDWVLSERERLRQLRLHALEALSAHFLATGDTAAAVDAALAMVALEPLRESGHGAVIRAHLSSGNQAEALLQFGRLSHLLQGELGIAPSRTVTELVKSLL